MSEPDADVAVVVWRSPTARVVLASIAVLSLTVLLSIVAIPLSALLVAPALGESAQAAATVGLILVEALVLYVGYGAVTRIASRIARELLVSA